ncbi:MAG: hypothetical protein WCL11_19165 [Verrucomicrobiota bacterium]
MNDDCYVLTNDKTGETLEVMVRSGELWLDLAFLPAGPWSKPTEALTVGAPE